jgi:hypothetical protein
VHDRLENPGAISFPSMFNREPAATSKIRKKQLGVAIIKANNAGIKIQQPIMWMGKYAWRTARSHRPAPVRERCADVRACVYARRVPFGRDRRVRWFPEGSVPVPDDAPTGRSLSSLFTPRPGFCRSSGLFRGNPVNYALRTGYCRLIQV